MKLGIACNPVNEPNFFVKGLKYAARNLPKEYYESALYALAD